MAATETINENGRAIDVITPDSKEQSGTLKALNSTTGTETIMSVQNLDKIPDIEKYLVQIGPAKDNIDLLGKAATVLSEAYGNAKGEYKFAYIGDKSAGNLLHLGLLGKSGFQQNISDAKFEIKSYTPAQTAANTALSGTLKQAGDVAGHTIDTIEKINIATSVYGAISANNEGQIRKSNEYAAKATGDTVKFYSGKTFEVVGFAACAAAAGKGAAGGAGVGAAVGGVGALPGSVIGGVVGYVVCGVIVMYSADKASEGLGLATEYATKEVLDNTRELEIVDVFTKQPVRVVIGNTAPAKAQKLGNATGKKKIIKLLHNTNLGIKVTKPVYNQNSKKPNSTTGNRPVDM